MPPKPINTKYRAAATSLLTGRCHDCDALPTSVKAGMATVAAAIAMMSVSIVPSCMPRRAFNQQDDIPVRTGTPEPPGGPHICRQADERHQLGIIPRSADSVFGDFAYFATSLRENRVPGTENVARA